MTALTALEARLKLLTSLTVYMGEVPDQPPADSSGKVYPYLFVMPPVGAAAEETKTITTTNSSHEFLARINVVAGKTTWLDTAVGLVRSQLADWFIQTGCKLTEYDLGQPVFQDTTVTPVRFVAPLAFRTLLT